MAKTFREYAPEQMLLLPPSLREWLPQDHAVYFVGDLVEALDLAPILSTYEEERGYPPYFADEAGALTIANAEMEDLLKRLGVAHVETHKLLLLR